MDFDIWKQRDIHKGKYFITDGIIDSERWNNSNIKILFLLKEAYSEDPHVEVKWDLTEYLRKGINNKIGKMWMTVSQWSWGIKKLVETSEIPCFDEDYKTNQEFNDAFLSCAVINIKKSSGNKSSNTEDLSDYVASDWDLLSEQIDEISPDLIICGYTWPLIKSKFNSKHCGEWLYKTDKYYFVDFWHPANQYPSKLNYYSLLAALKFSIELWRPKAQQEHKIRLTKKKMHNKLC